MPQQSDVHLQVLVADSKGPTYCEMPAAQRKEEALCVWRGNDFKDLLIERRRISECDVLPVPMIRKRGGNGVSVLLVHQTGCPPGGACRT